MRQTFTMRRGKIRSQSLAVERVRRAAAAVTVNLMARAAVSAVICRDNLIYKSVKAKLLCRVMEQMAVAVMLILITSDLIRMTGLIIPRCSTFAIITNMAVSAAKGVMPEPAETG